MAKKNRLTACMESLKKKKEKAFCAFLTLGYPSLKATEKLILEFDKEGVDVIELGFPFSDPMADGPTIQYSSEQALKRTIRVEDAFRLVKRVREKGCEVPIVFFTYLNPIFHYGLKRFARDAKKAGFEGVLVPDLPPDEEKEFQQICKKQNLNQIYLIAPTSVRDRVKRIASASSGFIYCVSLRGVTGARSSIASDIKKVIGGIRKQTKKPLLIGFGVSTARQAASLSQLGDGVIVGSAIVHKIRESRGKIQPVVRFVRSLVKATKRG